MAEVNVTDADMAVANELLSDCGRDCGTSTASAATAIAKVRDAAVKDGHEQARQWIRDYCGWEKEREYIAAIMPYDEYNIGAAGKEQER